MHRRARERIVTLAVRKLERETLDQDAAYRAAGLEPPGRLTPVPVGA